jgi:hypothetical protein
MALTPRVVGDAGDTLSLVGRRGGGSDRRILVRRSLSCWAECSRKMGFEVGSANDGRAALGWIDRNGLPDLVVTDLVVTDVRGPLYPHSYPRAGRNPSELAGAHRNNRTQSDSTGRSPRFRYAVPTHDNI